MTQCSVDQGGNEKNQGKISNQHIEAKDEVIKDSSAEKQ